MHAYRRMGEPIPLSFSAPSTRDDRNDFPAPPQNGGKFGTDILMGSPGGLASNLQHWTGGFYGKGGSSSDKFIGKNSNPYLQGEYGNLYTQENDDTFELLPYEKVPMQELPDVQEGYQPVNLQSPPSFRKVILFAAVSVAVYFILTLWAELGMVTLEKYLGGGAPLGVAKLGWCALGGTGILIFAVWLFGLSFVNILQNSTSD